jgi:ribosomal protein S27E
MKLSDYIGVWENGKNENVKYTKDNIAFPAKCPFCKSNETVVATYVSGERFVECEGCYTVIGDVVDGKIEYSGAIQYEKEV